MSSNQFPISVRDLEAWLPHRPPMIWVDDVVSATEVGGECQVRLRRDALYMGSDGVRQSSMIEWLAQSFGYVRAAQHVCGLIAETKTPSRVFLAAVRDAKYHVPLSELDVDKEELLRIQVSNIRVMSPLILFDGSVCSSRGLRLFDARMTVYSD